MLRHLKASAGLPLVIGLSACGSGGSSAPPASVSYAPPPSVPGTTPSSGPVTTPTTQNFDSPEYKVSSAAIGSNALGAWQQGASGKGIKIGFVDTGLNPDLADFAGRVDTASRSINGGGMSDGYGHGTANAGIAAAGRNDIGMMGIAYEATIVMMKADEGCPTACGFSLPNIVKGIDGARSAGAKVLNISIGGSGDGSITDAIDRAAGAGMVIVVGAGNFGDSPTGMATRIANAAPSNVIIVGGLGVSNADGSINWDVPSIYTTKAGMGINNFLTAPGWLNAAPSNINGLADFFSGTSFAAPVVSGAVALIAQAFPNLTGGQIVSLLFTTADDLGAPGVDDIYGHGRLNIGKAFQPQGSLKMANSVVAPTDAIGGSLPPAAGDAGGSLNAVALDELNRAYTVDLAPSLTRTSQAGPVGDLASPIQHSALTELGSMSVSMSIVDNGVKPRAGEVAQELINTTVIAALGSRSHVAFTNGGDATSLRSQLGGGAANSFLLTSAASVQGDLAGFDRRAFAIDHRFSALRVSASAETGRVRTLGADHHATFSSLSAGIDRRLLNGNVGLTITRLQEGETLLGGSLRSIYAAPGSSTYFLDAGLGQSFGRGWSISADYRRGWTAFSSGRLATSAFSFDVTKSGLLGGDRLAFRLSQPLRVEAGGLNFILPTHWNYDTLTSTLGSRSMSLKPSGREIAMEAGYFRSIAAGSGSLHVYARQNPGHSLSATADVGGAIRAQLKF